ncbi:MAG TPA: peptidyl-alpha-hydroxyglycine alpha-amidating lyase family protein [Bryobacterales bacterium]|jgi:DNA-binding beta-propeller fold protein YncE|nr:peptidyl-alpha-hydroxyglycine alpha-amidating lyase family protein [Bryobacterales bacterium]
MSLRRAGLVIVCFAAISLAQQRDIPDLGYKAVPDWPDLPAGWNFGEVASVAADSHGHVLVFHRGPHPIMEFDSGGKFVRSWGDGMISTSPGPNNPTYALVPPRPPCDSCGAHSVRLDPDGNIWVVDDGGHVVIKMNPQGRVVMELGRRGVPGSGHANFNLPTDVAFAPNGDFYVTDGYGNSRVVKFARDGRYLLEWGTRGSGPGEFLLPHAVVLDAQGRVYVADRESRRIEIFDSDGKFLRQWGNIGAFSGLAITGDQRIWAAGGGNVVLLNLEGQILGKLAPSGKLPGQVDAAHGIAVTTGGDVYVAELNWRVQKFVKK